MSEFILYVCNIPISWRSKAQWSVTLSSSKAEWIALVNAVKEEMFVSQILTSMKIHVHHHYKPYQSCIDIRYKFINEYVEDRTVTLFLWSPKKMMQTYSPRKLNGELHEKNYLCSSRRNVYLGEIPTYQVNEHCGAIQNQLRKIGRVSECIERQKQRKYFSIRVCMSEMMHIHVRNDAWLKLYWTEWCITKVVIHNTKWLQRDFTGALIV